MGQERHFGTEQPQQSRGTAQSFPNWDEFPFWEPSLPAKPELAMHQL